MSSRKELIRQCIGLQKSTYTEVAKLFTDNVDGFKGKIVRLAYCCDLVNNDLDELYEKRHFNYPASMMSIPPSPETDIPLRVCMYFNKVPVAYAIGDINVDENAFEIHFLETSNFFGNTGLKGWMLHLIDVLISLKEVLEINAGIQIDKMCIINPAHSTVNALYEMGYIVTHDYRKSMSAAIFKLERADTN